ncbi:flavoprotein [Streptomyces griseoviridis]|uniref:Flavoprotein n=1 Tax=Streptomyces hintoniae TaxID=3075521 RepID=A0ABU2UK97_9ACTN|nr:flavoprotein [Streptomyces sp. DSM 41014]MDT0473687.1 flavoprotein [Streptomyces sp. DSM 41014]
MQPDPTPQPRGTRRGALPPIVLPRGRLLFVATGGISVTALPEWAMLARSRYGWSVRVCLTRSAETLVSRQALAAVTRSPVAGPDWDTSSGVVPHKELAEWPDLIIVAPATTNFIAKCAAGMTDSLALTTVICTTAPVVFAPAIPQGALARPSVRRNLDLLREDGHHVVPMEPAISAHDGTAVAEGMPPLLSTLRYAARVLSAPAGEASDDHPATA